MDVPAWHVTYQNRKTQPGVAGQLERGYEVGWQSNDGKLHGDVFVTDAMRTDADAVKALITASVESAARVAAITGGGTEG